MSDGSTGNYVFLLVSGEGVCQTRLAQAIEAIPLRHLSARHTPQEMERCLLQTNDVLAMCERQERMYWRKHYPGQARVIVVQKDEQSMFGENYTDYVLFEHKCNIEALHGIVCAEQSRREYLKSRAYERHCFEYTATGLIVDATRTHLLLIPKPNGRWFPPGGHVEDGELLHRTLLREILEETGYTVSFLVK